MTINFNVTDDERLAICAIVERAVEAMPGLDQTDLTMAITACHKNGCPLKLVELEGADDFNFAHDVTGIHRHINPETGQLDGRFLPRYAAQ